MAALLVLALAPILLTVLWYFTATLTSTTLAPPLLLHNKRIILLIAHPDDEAMFFSPTLLSLTQPSLGNHLKILCLSTGDSEGLGETRRKELVESALTLGVRKQEDVFVMNDSRFRDGMKEMWKKEDVCRVLGMAFAPQIVTNHTSTPSTTSISPKPDKESTQKDSSKHRRKSSKHTSTTPKQPAPTVVAPKIPDGPRATIDVLITFDRHGISNHPNHIALHSGARLFISSIMRGHTGWACPVTLYTLPSVNLLRKYSFIVDAITTLFSGVVSKMSGAANAADRSGIKAEEKSAERVIFVNDLSRYWKARNAMVRGHKSQMVWFRWGWISLGRYMVVNDLKIEHVAGG